MDTIDKISSKLLKKLYLEKKLSSPEIGKIYQCSPEKIRTLLKKHKIKIRTKSKAIKLYYNIKITKKNLRELYLKRGMSSFEIARKFKCSPPCVIDRLKEYSIPIRSAYEAHLLCNKPRYKRYDFNGSLEEKAYLMGFSKGDLYVHSQNKNNSSIFIQTNSTKPKLIQIVEQSFSPYGHIWKSNTAKNHAVCIRCSLNKSFDFLLSEKDFINPWILKNKKYFAAFLAGYTDAEGTFCLCKGNAVFSIRSQDKNILYQIRSKLIKLGILLRPPQIARKKGTKDIRGTTSNKDIWAIFIHRKDAILKLIDLFNLYIKHADKKRRIKIVKDNIIGRNKKYNNRPDTKWYREYLKEGIKI